VNCDRRGKNKDNEVREKTGQCGTGNHSFSRLPDSSRLPVLIRAIKPAQKIKLRVLPRNPSEMTKRQLNVK
jgi:hypothetical protein